jgi:hypothetical protein
MCTLLSSYSTNINIKVHGKSDHVTPYGLFLRIYRFPRFAGLKLSLAALLYGTIKMAPVGCNLGRRRSAKLKMIDACGVFEGTTGRVCWCSCEHSFFFAY